MSLRDSGGGEQIRIFVISLATATARREAIRRQLEAQGLAFSFLDAVTASDAKRHPVVSAAVSQHALRLQSGLVVAATELACSLSHQAVYREIEAQALDGAFVLEDDALLESQFKEALAALAPVASTWRDRPAVIQCGRQTPAPSLVWGRKSQVHLGGVGTLARVIRFPEHQWGAFAYYVTREGARRLRRRSPDIADAWEWYLREGSLGEFWTLRPEPVGHPIDPSQASSQIHVDRANVRPPALTARARAAIRLKALRNAGMAAFVDPILTRLK